MKLRWYLDRLRAMSSEEIAGRVGDSFRRLAWRRRAPPASAMHLLPESDIVWPASWQGPQPSELRGLAGAPRLIAAADALLEGEWTVFGHRHPQFGEDPDWFVDAATGRRAPADTYAFNVPYRDQERIGNIKCLWEPARHHHLTLLAAAYYVAGEDRYAERVAAHLRSWFAHNPFLRGPHWLSGIELGIRLVSWVWTRRLLAAWRGAPALFEDNPAFRDQLYWHQVWLADFESRGSSANNHAVAEATGQFVAACAFPIFRESAVWRDHAARRLDRELDEQTFPSGLNRELATDYHGLVLDLALVGAIEAELAGKPLGDGFWARIAAMTDALAAIVDAKTRPPRQGDGDDAFGLLLDAPDFDRWQSLLASGRRLFGALAWWPEAEDRDVRTPLWLAGINPALAGLDRPAEQPEILADAGQVFLRAGRGADEIWCRADHGPHGFRSTAAHAHADALAIEVRVGGVEILTDPGTYCYHGDPEWRAYFRSTFGHNTLELFGENQSQAGGPFLWTRSAPSRLVATSGLEPEAPIARWEAEHSGYAARGALHRRSVTLERRSRTLAINDWIDADAGAAIDVRLAFHLGPQVDCHLDRFTAFLTWDGGEAEFDLPASLDWSAHRGEENPPLGWYSPTFDLKVPAVTLVGAGKMKASDRLLSTLRFVPALSSAGHSPIREENVAMEFSR